MRNLSRTAQLYILGIILVGGLGGIWYLRHLELTYPVVLILACILATQLQILKIEGPTPRSSYSLSWVVYGAVFAHMGGPETFITILVAHLGEWVRYRYPWYIQIFNITGFAITTVIAELAYSSLSTVPFNFYGFQNSLAVLGAMAVFTVVNHLMVGLVIKLARGQSISQSGVLTPTTISTDFGLLCLGVSSAIIAQENPTALVFLVIVAVILYNALRVPALERKAARTAELSRANAQLAQANSAKDEFMSTMNHEFRTPLNAILLYAESLQRKLLGPLNERQERAVQSIVESAQHLLLIINDTLDVAKLDAGKLTLDIVPTDIEEVCQSSLRLVSAMAQKKQLDIHFYRSPGITQVEADERRLKQMLVNLLNNTIKFTSEGGKIGLEVSSDPGNDIIHFTAWDTGSGIAQEDVKKLFQPFAQVEGGRGRYQGGTGLGLFLVNRMAELHGGNISVTSELGQGSRFTISLPRHQRRASNHENNPTSPVPIQPSISPATRFQEGYLADQATLWQQVSNATATTSKHAPVATDKGSSPLYDRKITVLIADDNEANVHALADLLQEWQCRILIARTGVEAVQQAKDQHPDIVFMDIQMPEMDGLEAIHQIRAEPSRRQIPIVVVTAMAMPGNRERYLAAGANDYLSKPLQIDRLAEVLDALLSDISSGNLP